MTGSRRIKESEVVAGARRAWRRLRPGGPEPEQIEVLVRKKKTAVCRLAGPAAAAFPLIAKRTRRRIAEVERILHERILPRLPLRSLAWYGSVEEEREEFCWLFLEDAGDLAFASDRHEHRMLAACWVVALHTAGARVGAAGLPERGSCEALERLRTTRDRILAHLDDGAPPSQEREVLGAILALYDVIEPRWEACAAICEEVPRTLVHGDFTKKNLRVRRRAGVPELLVLDWEHAGIGFPGIDLMVVDPAGYAQGVREHWSGMDAGRLERMFRIGRLFRCLAEVDWESRWLPFPPLVDRSVIFGRHASRLCSVVREAGWAS